jgi:hypothetical protein
MAVREGTAGGAGRGAGGGGAGPPGAGGGGGGESAAGLLPVTGVSLPCCSWTWALADPATSRGKGVATAKWVGAPAAASRSGAARAEAPAAGNSAIWARPSTVPGLSGSVAVDTVGRSVVVLCRDVVACPESIG